MKKQKGFISILGGVGIAVLAIAFLGFQGFTNKNVGDTIRSLPVATFLGLTDTPNTYVGQANKIVSVNAGETALEFSAAAVTAPCGIDTQIQFNDSGAFGCDTGFTWSKTIDTLGLPAGSIISWDSDDFTITGNTGAGQLEFAGATNYQFDGNLFPSGSGAMDLGGSGNTWNNIWLSASSTIWLANVPFLSRASSSNDGIKVGNGSANAIITSNGTFDLVLQTGNPTTGNIQLTDGANGNITIAPNGTGKTYLKNSVSTFGALLDTATIATSNKTFTFPNLSGTFAVAVSDTATVDLTFTGGTITADFASMAISQFDNDSAYLSGIVPLALGGTGADLFPATIGDILYADSPGTFAKLAGNTTTTKNWLSQTGDGLASQAPVWETLTLQDSGWFVGARLTALGTTQATALALSGNYSFQEITTSSNGVNEGVILPAPTLETIVAVKNADKTNNVVVYPAVGTKIDGGLANVSVSLPPNGMGLVIASSISEFYLMRGVTFDTTAPAALGSADVGTALTVSRNDHVHPSVNLATGSGVTGTLAAAFFPALTGDVTTSAGSLATSIANNAVTNTDIRDSGALSVIGRSANSSGDPADISATAASGAVLRESGSVLGFGTIVAAGIASDAITEAKLKAVDAAVDEDIITYESTTGDFEYHTCAEITGSAGLCDGNDASGSFDSTTIDATTWSDGLNASNVWTFDLSGTDTTLTFGSDLFTFNGGVTLTTGNNFILGTTQWNTGDSIDGEQIANDTIDDDSIDFADVTGIDITLTDAGAITASGLITGNANLNIANGATSSGILKILEDTDDGSNFATFQVPALAADTVYILPADDGDASEQLQTNGSGTLSWEAPGFSSMVIQSFTVAGAGTYTPTSGMKFAKVICTGGGGNSGTAANTDSVTGGGGGGGTAIRIYTAAEIGVDEAYVVGAATTDSTFSAGGTLLTCGAGEDTAEGAGGTVWVDNGGAGGTASGGTTNLTGQGGGLGVIATTTVGFGGTGGASYWGGGAVAATSDTIGVAGTNWGSGAAGAHAAGATDRAGANGAVGIIYIEEYI